jgi:hypothetical protein
MQLCSVLPALCTVSTWHGGIGGEDVSSLNQLSVRNRTLKPVAIATADRRYISSR